MKTMRLLAATLLCTLVTTTAGAQDNLIKAFDNFVGDKNLAEYIKGSTFIENSDNSYYYSYSFELPMNKKKALNALLAAFNKDMGAAYSVYTKDANISSVPITTIAYGSKLDKNIEFGVHKERNYKVMLVNDSQDSLRRYAYAIVWYKNNEDDKLCGSLHKIYSLNPQKQEKKPNINLYGPLFADTDGTGSPYSLNFNTDIPDNYKIENSMDFLRRFGSLRGTFVNPDLRHQNSVKTVVANKIVELCRTYSHLLNQEERDICINAIKDMQKIEYDKYIKDLFGIAVSSLKK